MRMDLIQAHKARWQKKKTASVPRAKPKPLKHQQKSQLPSALIGSEHDEPLQVAALEVDLAALGTVNSLDRRKVKKRDELIPRYRKYVDARMAAAQKAGAVHVQMMIWVIDVDDFEYGLALADYALEHDGLMPERFNRDIPNFILGQVADWARETQKQGSAMPWIGRVYDWMEAHPDWDIVDKIKALMLAAMAHELEATDPKRAASLYEQGLTLDGTLGVKRRLKQLNRNTWTEPAKGSEN